CPAGGGILLLQPAGAVSARAGHPLWPDHENTEAANPELPGTRFQVDSSSRQLLRPRALAPAYSSRRIATAVQRASRRYVTDRPETRTTILHSQVRRSHPALRRPAPHAGWADRMGTGAWPHW